MLIDSPAFSSFSTDDLSAAKHFYTETFGLVVAVEAADSMPMLTLQLTGGGTVLLYAKDDHQPASFTVLNFPVDNIDTAVADLKAKGVQFEHYDGMTDDSGVARGLSHNHGPDIAWFKDPAGNILAVLQQ